MLPLSHPIRWRVAGISLLLVVLGFALAPEMWPWMNDRGSEFFADKWMHGITFTFLAIWFSGQFARHSYWWLVIGLLGFGAFIEVCQSMTSYRTAESADFFADALGVATGFLIAVTGLGGWSLRFERWLKNGPTK